MRDAAGTPIHMQEKTITKFDTSNFDGKSVDQVRVRIPPTDVTQFDAFATYRETNESNRPSNSPQGEMVYQTEGSSNEQEE